MGFTVEEEYLIKMLVSRKQGVTRCLQTLPTVTQ